MRRSFLPKAAGPSSLARRWVAFVLRHGKIIWALAILLGAFGAWRTHYVYSRLRSELEELLPRSSKSVLAIDELRERVSGLQYLGVVVDTANADNVPAAERMLDDLAARVRAYPPDLVRAVRTGDAEERAFFEKHAALYVDTTDLEQILTRIEARRDWEVSRQEGSSLEDDNATAPPLDFSDIQKKYEGKVKGHGNTENGRFASSKLHTALLLIEAASFSSAQGKGAVLLHRVKDDLAALGGPEHYAPGMRVGYAGDIAITVEETSALVSDLSFSSVLVGVLVLGSLFYFFRWWPSFVILLAPLSIATVLAFGIASLPPFHVTELNSNTAFLGAIIVGNGINVGIMLLSRHVEERRRGLSVERALEHAVWGVCPGTLSAALAASTSYVSLVLTQFRGFRQFGIIGGLGMVLAWISAFILIPPLTAWLDRKGNEPKSAPRTGLTAPIAQAVKMRPGVVVGVATLLTIVAALLIVRIGDNQLEHDFSKLRRRDTWTAGEGYWGRRMDALLGAYLTPTAILTDNAEHAERAAAAVRKERDEGRFGDLVTTVRTIDDVLPQHQEEKIALLERIEEAMTPRMRASVPEDKREDVERLLDQAETKSVGVEDLPRTFTTGLREKDGHTDRIVLVYPKPSKALWEGRSLAGYVTRLREIARDTAPAGIAPARVAGSLALSTDILESIRRDGPRASLAALAGVMVIVLVLFRFTSATAEVIGSLLMGVAWMLGLSIGFNIKINFANFIAFPITFGIGVEYAVNVMTRYVQDGAKDTTAAVRATGGAVALCSATTVIGYSSLLMAQNRALFLFGLLAVLGEITCLTVAVLVLPAFLEWRSSKRKGMAGARSTS